MRSSYLNPEPLNLACGAEARSAKPQTPERLLHYLSKKTLNSTATPERVVLTTSPVTMIGFGDLGNLNVMAISCPMDNGLVVFKKIPEPLMS